MKVQYAYRNIFQYTTEEMNVTALNKSHAPLVIFSALYVVQYFC